MANETTNQGWIDRGTPMLTTFDNPYDPFTEFSKWYVFDTVHGYDCCGYIGRMAQTSPGFTDGENNRAIEDAIDNLLEADFLHRYRKVYDKAQDHNEN